MGATITALSDSRTALQRNPMLVLYTTVAVAAMTVATFVVGLVGLVVPLLPNLVVGIVVVPVGLTAIIGVVFAGVNGQSPVDGATKALRRYAPSLIGAHAIYQFAVLGLMLVFLVLTVFTVGLGAVSAGSGLAGGPNAAAMSMVTGGASLLLLVLAGFLFLVFLAVGIFVQFLDVAVVLSGRGAIGAYREVVQFVAAAPVSVLGYTVLRGLVFVLGVFLPLGAVGWLLATAGVGDLATAAVLGLLALLLFPLVTTFLYVYHVAYYQRRQRAPIV